MRLPLIPITVWENAIQKINSVSFMEPRLRGLFSKLICDGLDWKMITQQSIQRVMNQHRKGHITEDAALTMLAKRVKSRINNDYLSAFRHVAVEITENGGYQLEADNVDVVVLDYSELTIPQKAALAIAVDFIGLHICPLMDHYSLISSNETFYEEAENELQVLAKHAFEFDDVEQLHQFLSDNEDEYEHLGWRFARTASNYDEYTFCEFIQNHLRIGVVLDELRNIQTFLRPYNVHGMFTETGLTAMRIYADRILALLGTFPCRYSESLSEIIRDCDFDNDSQRFQEADDGYGNYMPLHHATVIVDKTQYIVSATILDDFMNDMMNAGDQCAATLQDNENLPDTLQRMNRTLQALHALQDKSHD
jgi:hypothetical protein